MTPNFEAGGRASSPWEALDRFVQELQSGNRTVRQFRLLLQTIRESIEADVVFLHSPSSEEGLEIVGDRALPPSWCRQFADRLLADVPADITQVLRSGPELVDISQPHAVGSAALVQVSRSKKAWAVALRFSLGRVFVDSDVKLMAL